MRIEFTTNIDCCKPFVAKLSNMPNVKISEMNPLVGDRVLVNASKQIWLKVVERRWRVETEFYTPVLECELHLEYGTIPELEKRLRT